MPTDLQSLRALWQSHWPAALRCWSPYVQLSEPAWCLTPEDDQRENLTASFAMIRLVDHRIVISLSQIADNHLEDFALEILAHEIGHHILCPADLSDNARMLIRLRAGLPSKEHLAPFIGNLYTDLLINDRLQRSNTLRMADVYHHINKPTHDRLWILYMRAYELLWRCDRNALALANPGELDERINNDAILAARLIRSYARDWLGGAGRFAALCLPYLLENEAQAAQKRHALWNDAQTAGHGGTPDGLAEIEAGERDAIHPSEDPELSGSSTDSDDNPKEPANPATSHAATTGIKTLKTFRGPAEYKEVLKAAGATIPNDLIIARYYRERAMPHLIPFPAREIPNAVDPTPEGLDTWDIASPLENIDWMGTLIANPTVIPGLTTRERLTSNSPGNTPTTLPLDLYLGVDCSGSMGNPATQMSWPILAGAVIALSALRAGAKVMVALSGEPGKTITTPGFIRDEQLILKTLTDYLGTGTTFGIHRLADAFPKPDPKRRPAHILIVTDNDIFNMLDRTAKEKSPSDTGWEIARRAALFARGGATYVLQLPAYLMNQTGAKEVIHPGEAHMIADGWTVAHVNAEQEMLAFAKRFANARYGGGSRV